MRERHGALRPGETVSRLPVAAGTGAPSGKSSAQTEDVLTMSPDEFAQMSSQPMVQELVIKLQRRVRDRTQHKTSYLQGGQPIISAAAQSRLGEERTHWRQLDGTEFEVSLKGQAIMELATHSPEGIAASLSDQPIKNHGKLAKALVSSLRRLCALIDEIEYIGQGMVHPTQLLHRVERAAAALVPDCTAIVYEIAGGQSVDGKRGDSPATGSTATVGRDCAVDSRALPCVGEAVSKGEQVTWPNALSSCPGLAFIEAWKARDAASAGQSKGKRPSGVELAASFFFDMALMAEVEQQLTDQGLSFHIDKSRNPLAHSMLASPLLTQAGQPLGALFLHQKKGKSFNEDDEIILSLFCEFVQGVLCDTMLCSLDMDYDTKLSQMIQDVRLNCSALKDLQGVAKEMIPSDNCFMLTWAGAEKNLLRPLVDSGLPASFFDGVAAELEATQARPKVLIATEKHAMQQEGPSIELLRQLPIPDARRGKLRSFMVLPMYKPIPASEASLLDEEDVESERRASIAMLQAGATALVEEARLAEEARHGSMKRGSVTIFQEGVATVMAKVRQNRQRMQTAWHQNAHTILGLRRRNRVELSGAAQSLEGAMLWINRCRSRSLFDDDDEVEAERFGQLTMSQVTWLIESAKSRVVKSNLLHAQNQKNALVETAKLLGGNLDILTLFSSIMKHAKEIMEVDRSTLFLYDRERRELWSKVADGIPPIRIPSHAGIAGAVCTNKVVEKIDDAYSDPRFNKAIDKKTGYRTKNILAVPILAANGAMLGVLQLINKTTALNFSQEDIVLAEAFTKNVAIGIQNALTYEAASDEHAVLSKAMHETREQLDAAVVLTSQVEFEPLRAAFKQCAARLAKASSTEVFVVNEYTCEITQEAKASEVEPRTHSILLLCRENRPTLLSLAARCAKLAIDGDESPLIVKGRPLASPLGCVLLSPLRSRRTGRLVGVLAAGKASSVLTDEEMRWLTTLSDVGAAALESILRYEQLDRDLARAEMNTKRYQAILKIRRDEYVSQLRRSSMKATSQTDVFTSPKVVLRVLDATSCNFYLTDWRREVLCNEALGTTLPLKGLLGWVARSGAVVNLADATIHSEYDPVVDAACVKSVVRHPTLLIVPILSSEQSVIGLLQAVGKKSDIVVHNGRQKPMPPRPFNKDDENFLRHIAAQIALALERVAQSSDRPLDSLVEGVRSNDDDEHQVADNAPPRSALQPAPSARPTTTANSIRTPRAVTPRAATPRAATPRAATPRAMISSQPLPARLSAQPPSPRGMTSTVPPSPRRKHRDEALPALPTDMVWPSFGDRVPIRPAYAPRSCPIGLPRAALSPRQPVASYTASLPRAVPPRDRGFQPSDAASDASLASASPSIRTEGRVPSPAEEVLPRPSLRVRRASSGRDDAKENADERKRHLEQHFTEPTEVLWEDLFATVRQLTVPVPPKETQTQTN